MKNVLELIKENSDLALELAKGLLAADTEEKVSNIFADIAKQAAAAGVEDPEQLLQIELEAKVNKFKGKFALEVASVRNEYIKNAKAAKSETEL